MIKTSRNNNAIVLTKAQQIAFDKLIDFIRDENAKVFILKGYAGTGKTTLIRELIAELGRRNESYKLLASTGRAAKVLRDVTHIEATTIHSTVYAFSGLNCDLDEQYKDEDERSMIDNTGQLLLTFEANRVLSNNTQIYYIVDEASMVSDTEDRNPTQAIFGSGRLLNDFLNHDSNGKYIFVGDICQLPPVIESNSPALDSHYFESSYQIKTEEAELTEIVRQNTGNDIINAAHRLRRMYANPPQVKWAKFPLRGYQHIKLYGNSTFLLNQYIEKIKKNGYESATLICRGNKQCSVYSKLIRPSLGFVNGVLMVGDLLLVTQNNLLSGLMNGDLVRVTQIGNMTERACLTFIEVEVEELVSKRRFKQYMILDLLYGEGINNLTQEQQKTLLIDFYLRMRKQGIKQKSSEFRRQMFNDVYLNALRAIYGYALTCHKTQGGEWKDVYVDIPRSLAFKAQPSAYQWLYTAITRAKDSVHIVDDFYL